MRISDWSSDVCSSDLHRFRRKTRKTPMFKGSFVALITPFRKGKVDEKAFGDFVEWQIAQGTHGLVPVGTTGESPTLSHDEHKRVVEICIEAAHGRELGRASCRERGWQYV